jgi:hypothetical protein
MHHIRTMEFDQHARKARQLSNLELDQRRAAELKVGSPESLSKRLVDYANLLDKTGQALEKMAVDPSIRLTRPIPLVHTESLNEDRAGGQLQ